jgi:hypothetical protein
MIGIGSRSHQFRLPEDSRRPPSSGHLDWVLIDDWREDEASTLDDPGVERKVAVHPEALAENVSELGL